MAGTPWLVVFCPGCQTGCAIDIRTIDRHPMACVGSLALGLGCSWCLGAAPMPKIMGLYQLPPAGFQVSRATGQGITKDERAQEQPADKKRALQNK